MEELVLNGKGSFRKHQITASNILGYADLLLGRSHQIDSPSAISFLEVNLVIFISNEQY